MNAAPTSPRPGPIVRGGITDKLLGDYPNLFGDVSANSGNNMLSRDAEFTAGFVRRHQDKLLYGSDCQDILGKPEEARCCGSQMLAMIQKLVPDAAVRSKLLAGNAKRVFKLA